MDEEGDQGEETGKKEGGKKKVEERKTRRDGKEKRKELDGGPRNKKLPKSFHYHSRQKILVFTPRENIPNKGTLMQV
jgi:hypothetical protein